MKRLDPIHPLNSAVIETLAERRRITVKDLHVHLEEQFDIQVSWQNLYRLIKRLTDEDVLVKEQGKISLSWNWVTHLLRFADSVRFHYSGGESVLEGLPQTDGEKINFSSDSLMGLDLVWINILIRLLDSSEEKEWFAYNSHPWYAIGSLDTETRFFERLVLHGVSVSMVYGNDTFLDRYGEKLLAMQGFQTTINTRTGMRDEGYALWVCGDYLIDVHFPDIIARHFATFFRSVKSLEQFNPELFAGIFMMKAQCQLSVELSKKRAKKERERIKRCFS